MIYEIESTSKWRSRSNYCLISAGNRLSSVLRRLTGICRDTSFLISIEFLGGSVDVSNRCQNSEMQKKPQPPRCSFAPQSCCNASSHLYFEFQLDPDGNLRTVPFSLQLTSTLWDSDSQNLATYYDQGFSYNSTPVNSPFHSMQTYLKYERSINKIHNRNKQTRWQTKEKVGKM
jgi:hypothetical protein